MLDSRRGDRYNGCELIAKSASQNIKEIFRVRPLLSTKNHKSLKMKG